MGKLVFFSNGLSEVVGKIRQEKGKGFLPFQYKTEKKKIRSKRAVEKAQNVAVSPFGIPRPKTKNKRSQLFAETVCFLDGFVYSCSMLFRFNSLRICG